MSTEKKPNEVAPRLGDMQSINEPPGSATRPDQPAQENVEQASQGVTNEGHNVARETSALPSDGELEGMTRAELNRLADERGVDISLAHNKDDVIAALKKDARKRTR